MHTQFLDQLGHWAEKALAEGRFPFRKIEQHTDLLTEFGRQTADLVFWVNQNSFVAGGVLLLVTGQTGSAEQRNGTACASALGLKQFALWDQDGITLWSAPEMILQWRLELPPESVRIDFFFDALLQLMDQFRLRSVIEAPSSEQLSSWHLTNLCRHTLEQARPLLSEGIRRTRAELLPVSEHLAQEKLILSLAQLLTFLYRTRRPAELTLHTLDARLTEISLARGVEAGHCEQIRLDEQSTILLHHLFRRLEQISPFSSAPRATRFLRHLLELTAPQSDHQAAATACCTDATVAIYCNDIGAQQLDAEIDSCGRLLLKQLLRDLLGLRQPVLTATSLFKLTEFRQPARIRAHLFDPQRPSRPEEKILGAHLRQAWPGRRFESAQGAALFLWQALYLLGQMPSDSTLRLTIPGSLFDLLGAETLLNELSEHFLLSRIDLDENARTLELVLARTASTDRSHRLNTQQAILITQQRSKWAALTTSEEQISPAKRGNPTRQALREDILRTVAIRGVPCFPEHYLYDLFRPELVVYPLENGPWEIDQNFMGLLQLKDKTGQRTCEADPVHSYALILASHQHQQVRLPQDETVCREILIRFLTDLIDIRRLAQSECFGGLTNPAQARRCLTEVWHRLELPPWSVVKSAANFFHLEHD
ncbi:MAG: hypothetical protein JXR59_01290 [Desulfuromonadaceae bacterium]|nr:hypothetical protein [Desulfuromonadaceae bacterium]